MYQSERAAKWKKESIEGELERQGKHILHTRELYGLNGLFQLHFYCTDHYSAVEKIVYNARIMRRVSRESVSVPHPLDYAPNLMIANAAPFAVYYVAYGLSQRFMSSFLIGLFTFRLSRLYIKNLSQDYSHDKAAWNEYHKYAASLESIPEPEELGMNI